MLKLMRDAQLDIIPDKLPFFHWPLTIFIMIKIIVLFTLYSMLVALLELDLWQILLFTPLI